jgi:hypothetical protein
VRPSTPNPVTTAGALRIMGVWVRRADAILANQGLANAATAVNDLSRVGHEQRRALAAIDLRAVPVQRVDLGEGAAVVDQTVS